MWQEDVTELVRLATGQERLVLARVPADKGADWAAVPLRRAGGAIPAALLHLPEVATGATDGDRWLLTLTDRARGQVVPSLLGSHPPRRCPPTGCPPTGYSPYGWRTPALPCWSVRPTSTVCYLNPHSRRSWSRSGPEATCRC